MPNYYNPYNFYPVSYANQMGYNMPIQQPVNQQSFSQQPQQKAMEWVEGEVGAKAFQMPPNWPANTPIPLWDSTDTLIYLKSWSPMGIPNPMQKLHYTMEDQQNSQQLLMSGSSGSVSNANQDMSQYATKDELNQIRTELQNVLNSARNAPANQNGSVPQNNNGNRGGNR